MKKNNGHSFLKSMKRKKQVLALHFRKRGRFCCFKILPADTCSRRHYNGFTLLEIMIALVILAIAFLAVLRTTQSNIQSTLHVKNALISNWVALNIYSELQLGILSLSNNTSLQGTTNMLQADWNWRVSVMQSAPDNSFKRVEIDVSQQGKIYQHLIGFVGS